MQLYLSLFSYTPEALARLTQNPQDRSKAVRESVEARGGRPVAFYHSSGEYHGAVITEEADDLAGLAGAWISEAAGHLRRSRASRCTRPRRRCRPCATRAASPCEDRAAVAAERQPTTEGGGPERVVPWTSLPPFALLPGLSIPGNSPRPIEHCNKAFFAPEPGIESRELGTDACSYYVRPRLGRR